MKFVEINDLNLYHCSFHVYLEEWSFEQLFFYYHGIAKKGREHFIRRV